MRCDSFVGTLIDPGGWCGFSVESETMATKPTRKSIARPARGA